MEGLHLRPSFLHTMRTFYIILFAFLILLLIGTELLFLNEFFNEKRLWLMITSFTAGLLLIFFIIRIYRQMNPDPNKGD
jgi:hypothetical protein